MHLLEDDNEWFQTFKQAVEFATGRSLRSLFVVAVVYGSIGDPLALWNRFKSFICEDLAYRLSQLFPVLPDIPDREYDYGLFLISELLEEAAVDPSSLNLPIYQGP